MSLHPATIDINQFSPFLLNPVVCKLKADTQELYNFLDLNVNNLRRWVFKAPSELYLIICFYHEDGIWREFENNLQITWQIMTKMFTFV